MKILIFRTFAILFLLLGTNLKAQYKNFKFKHFNEEDGLSHETILKIVEDSLGYIWLRTFDGVNRFDGRNFIFYDLKNTDGLTSPKDIFCDKYNVWFIFNGCAPRKFNYLKILLNLLIMTLYGKKYLI